MDFSVRTAQHPPTVGQTTPGSGNKKNRLKNVGLNSWIRLGTIVLLFGMTVLLVAIALLLNSGNHDESQFINSKEFQAVDISVGGSSNGDQIYFGNITRLNTDYLVLENVYYIPTNASGSNITLEPLVCQVDAPYNQMVVNRASVNWWENLQSSGKVAQAITNYEKSNKTPACPTSSTSNSSSSSSSGNGSSSSSSSNSSSSTNKSSSSTGSTGSTTPSTGSSITTTHP